MTFLSPWAVWALASIPLVVALYFLRLKRRALKVSTHMFWERAANQTSRNAFFQRLRHLLSLLLHLIIVLLLAGALAKPVVDRFIHDGASVVLILDSRARMQAVGPDGVTRYEKALNAAKSYIRDAGNQRQFALVTLDSAATVTVPFSGEEKPLSDALAVARVSDATGEIDSAVRLANSLLQARKGDRRIILLSDRAPQSVSPFPLTAHAFPAIAGNLAITRFATRPLPANPETSEVLLEVRNFGSVATKATVELSYDGRPLDAKALTLAPNSASMTVFPAVIKAGRASRGWLEAKIDTADALPLDNRAFATIPPPRAKRILLISDGNFFLEKIMESDASVKFEMLTPDAYSPEIGSKFSAVIFDRILPAGFDLAKSEGNFLFVKTTPFPAGNVLDQPLVTDLDSTHPTARNVNLRNVSILHAQSLALPASENGWQYTAPLRSFDNALLIAGQRGQQRVAALAFDVADSDLPLRVAFPLLISNTVHWLAGEEPDALPGVTAGKTFPLEPAQKASATALTAWPKDGIISPPELTGAFRPMKSGFYQIADSNSARWLAVNTFSADESNIYADSSDGTAAPLPGAVLSGWPIWQWLAIAAFALSIFEWWLHHRRRTE